MGCLVSKPIDPDSFLLRHNLHPSLRRNGRRRLPHYRPPDPATGRVNIRLRRRSARRRSRESDEVQYTPSQTVYNETIQEESEEESVYEGGEESLTYQDENNVTKSVKLEPTGNIVYAKVTGPAVQASGPETKEGLGQARGIRVVEKMGTVVGLERASEAWNDTAPEYRTFSEFRQWLLHY